MLPRRPAASSSTSGTNLLPSYRNTSPYDHLTHQTGRQFAMPSRPELLRSRSVATRMEAKPLVHLMRKGVKQRDAHRDLLPRLTSPWRCAPLQLRLVTGGAAVRAVPQK